MANTLTELTALQDGHFQVSGVLDFVTVIYLKAEGLRLFGPCAVLKIDLSKVSSANSAGIALLLEWKKSAVLNKKQIEFLNVPEQLHSIAKVAGAEWLF